MIKERIMTMGKTVHKPGGNAAKKGNPESSKDRSICSTCIHAPACTYQKDPDRPVLQCEEFDNCGETSKRNSGTNGSCAENSQVKPEANKNPGTSKGLCMDCDNRETCLYAKPEEGVWHCTEYQ